MNPILSLRDVSYEYRGLSPAAPLPALKGINLDIGAGERLVIAGANGSGKTTLGLVLAGVFEPTGGEIIFENSIKSDIGTNGLPISMIFQSPEDTFVAPTLEEDVAFGPENLGLDQAEIRRVVDASLARVGLLHLAGRHPAALSGGQKQLAALAGALASSPRVLIVDEGTGYLDLATRRHFLGILDELHRQGMTLIVITQEVEEMWLGERLLVLDGGRVAFLGKPESMLMETERCRRLGMENDPLAELADALRRRGLEVPGGVITAASLESWFADRSR